MRYLLVLLLCGCSATWVNPEKSDQQFYEDSYECQRQAMAMTQLETDPLYSPRNNLWRGCIRAKGWREE